MLKKIILASVLATTTGTAIADLVPYVGGSVGITTNTANVNILNSNVSVGAYRGVPFNLFAGYGGVINQNFYLAGEIFGTVGTANISDNTELKTSYGYGVSVIPGVMLSDHTLFYGRLGVLQSRFSSRNDTRTGGQFGLGMQTCLTQNIDLRAEYDFVAYKSVNGSNTILGKNTSWSVAPRSDQFSLGLVYKFD